jgi:hypothetical protein
MAAEKNRIKYPIKQINNNNNDLPKGTKDKCTVQWSPQAISVA